MRKKKSKNAIVIIIVEAAILIAIFAMIISSINSLKRDSSSEGARQLESSVRRAVMACYASEGVYPPNIQYLQDNYGLLLNSSKYAVKYLVFAENIMPDITVIELN